MNSQEIQERQNEEKYLKVQYAARVYFNSAEKYNYLAWVACLVSAFSIFLPGSWSPYIINGIPFIADIFAVILSLVASYKIKWASKLRKYFDSYVLNIDMNQRSETDIRKMRERTEKICCKNPNDTAIQIANTGKDSPPGVRNWYEFSSFYSGFDVSMVGICIPAFVVVEFENVSEKAFRYNICIHNNYNTFSVFYGK